MVILPIEQETYDELICDGKKFRKRLDELIEKWPQLFPDEIEGGYHLHGKRGSSKLEGVQLQRIQLRRADEEGQKIVLTIKPSTIMPYMSGYTDEVEKGLYLAHKHRVPPSGLAYVFGRSDSYWRRQVTHLGHYSIVETTVQKPEIPDGFLYQRKWEKNWRQSQDHQG